MNVVKDRTRIALGNAPEDAFGVALTCIDHPAMFAFALARQGARLAALADIGSLTKANDSIREIFRHLVGRKDTRWPLTRACKSLMRGCRFNLRGMVTTIYALRAHRC